MKTEILKILLEATEAVSGEEISKQLDVSRAGVWKHIQALKEDGCIIEAQTNRGYKLHALPDLLKPEYVNLYLPEEELIIWYQETDSTNTQGKMLAKKKKEEFFVVLAEHQSGGKGRLGRAWVSNPGEAIQMSFVVKPLLPPSKAPALNFAIALGVCEAVQEMCSVDVKIKWPNDVVFGAKKLCGILTEMSADMDKVDYLVSGVGVNVNQQSFAGEIEQRAVSLRMIAGDAVDRVKMCAALIKHVKSMYNCYVEGGMEALMPLYMKRSAILNSEITVSCGEERYTGVCTGFGENGELIIKTQNGERSFLAGEVSVRGMKDYV
ncbi:biotin--[acetyl-CoA-carboxylase] ligase [Christensenellaceae bacterium OttesenSCG-928-K19]|nr:biotin--[acetyl-CoA-carboxylase] ligase [Christensenellaceae bacterium OttesenSCG-928-K19]